MFSISSIDLSALSDLSVMCNYQLQALLLRVGTYRYRVDSGGQVPGRDDVDAGGQVVHAVYKRTFGIENGNLLGWNRQFKLSVGVGRIRIQ